LARESLPAKLRAGNLVLDEEKISPDMYNQSLLNFVVPCSYIILSGPYGIPHSLLFLSIRKIVTKGRDKSEERMRLSRQKRMRGLNSYHRD
jgi:hypothetical protein